MKTEVKNLIYTFSKEEIELKGRELAKLNNEAKELDDQKKASAADFKAKIDSKMATINVESVKINQGYEYRDVKCDVMLHHPREGIKTLTRLDTSETWQEEMTNSDLILFNDSQ